MEKNLFRGLKIIEFGWFLAGPLTTKYFADFGAEVIRIESTKRIDQVRTDTCKDGIIGVNRAGMFNQVNSGKLSVTINLADREGVKIVERLIARTDIVVENMAPGAMERRGLGYEDLKKIKPDIIMCSSCLQGHTGPHADNRGFGSMLVALAGIGQITGWPDQKPADLGVYSDVIVPHFQTLTILAALDYRRRTGRGQYLDMSHYEQCVQYIAPLLLDYSVNKRQADRIGNRSDYAAPHGAYRCLGEDRWCSIAVFTDDEWQSFCKVIGNPEWTDNPEFSTLLARKRNEDELDKLVEEWTIQHKPEDVMNAMQAAGVAAGVLQTGEDLLEHDPQLEHQDFCPEGDHPEIGHFRNMRPAVVLSKVPCEMKRGPLLGEHNEYVLREILALSDGEITKLQNNGVIQ